MSAPRRVTVDVKSWYSSKTVIVAIITIVLGVLAMPEVSQLIPQEYLGIILSVVGVLNLILRFLTSQPIVNPPPEAPLAE